MNWVDDLLDNTKLEWELGSKPHGAGAFYFNSKRGAQYSNLEINSFISEHIEEDRLVAGRYRYKVTIVISNFAGIDRIEYKL